MMNYSNYYLDLEKVSKLETLDERERIHNYYSELLHSSNDKRDDMARSIFHTLYNNGYLKEVRDEKIEQILS
jgi:hypothetical protein